MSARDALARLRRQQAYEPSARELLLSRRRARLIIDDNNDTPPRDYVDSLPFAARPMFGLCETILIGSISLALGAVLIWLIARLLWS